ncbi:MAG: hypothetical protein PQJ61_06535 [Spirochaetales bacterium]|uniref:Uncharacterized protein n=1 Tax=Candidatus Thalassospirochaeta sargassi TaxID=3119039 RepID=A0AAJ1IEL6_9SPIO|nr:hypothetical protein [Spirochaetales bacterium]
MKKRLAPKNGIQKISPVFLWISALFRPAILIGLGKTLGSIFAKFFFLQFQTVLFPKTRPVVNVDHKLDDNIPFDPSWVALYNTFTAFWMKSAGWLLKTFGKGAVNDIAEFTEDMFNLYNAAGDVYKVCQSTTNRPGVSANLNFIVIHTFDPHLHCVPSLHVMVCAYTGFKTCELIRKHADNPEDYKAEIDWVYKNSLEIIESVLLVKQHSVNCIPAGYYMVSAMYKEFRNGWADKYINGMFADDAKGITDISDIQSHIRSYYDKFIEEFDSGASREAVLLDFLNNYKSGGVEIG